MTAKVLLALFAAGSLAFPASANDEREGDDRGALVCHRTGKKPVDGRFAGVIIRTSTTGANNHHLSHGDVIVEPAAMWAFETNTRDEDEEGKRKGCQTNAARDLFNAKGELVQPAPGAPGEGADPGGPS